MKRAIIYARVSTEMQREKNTSIPDQIRVCMNYIASKGYTLVGDAFIDPQTGADTGNYPGAVLAYVDDVSGERYPRPALDRALDYFDRIGFDIMIIAHRDRLTRDGWVTAQVWLDFCEMRQITLEVIEGAPFDDTSSGQIGGGLEDLMKKYENSERARRSKSGKLHKARELKLFVGAGRVPYGYKLDRLAFGGLAIDPGPADVVRFIFDQYYNHNASINRIAKILTESDALPQDQGAAWGKTTIHRILENTAYKGMVYYNKFKVIRNKKTGQKTYRMRDRSEWIPIEITPIVDPLLFDAVQERLEHNRDNVRKNPKRFYLLSGMVICDVCNRSYMCQTAKPAEYNRIKDEKQSYRHRIASGHCQNREISARRLEPWVWNSVIELLNNPEKLRTGYNDARALEAQEQTRQRALLAELYKMAEKLDKRRQRLLSAYMDPEFGMTKGEYIDQKKILDDEAADIEQRIQESQYILSNLPTPEEYAEFEAFAYQVRDRLFEVDPTPQNMRDVLEMLRATVKIGKDEGDIWLEGWFGSKKVVTGLSSTTC